MAIGWLFWALVLSLVITSQAIKPWKTVVSLYDRVIEQQRAQGILRGDCLPEGLSGPHFFQQPLDHADPQRRLWPQRYFVSYRHYRANQTHVPVILLDGGIVDILAQSVGGIGIILEHRYYGDGRQGSYPVSNFSTENMKWLDLDQTLRDTARFMTEISLPGIETNVSALSSPWIYYGGSYAGAKAAIMAKEYPELVWGAIGSSAVTLAQENYWQYYEGIRRGGPKECINAIQDVVQTVDRILGLPDLFGLSRLKWQVKHLFGLADLQSDVDFTSVLALPLGDFQSENWLEPESSSRFRQLCQALSPYSQGRLSTVHSLYRYAGFIKKTYVKACHVQDRTVEECFGTMDKTAFQGTDIASNAWRAWLYQVCTQWGYFMPSPPPSHPHRGLISKLQTLEYEKRICKMAFGLKGTPETAIVNSYGGRALHRSRLGFIDGECKSLSTTHFTTNPPDDPWREVTPHAHGAGRRRDTLNQPFHLIPRATHHWDESGLRNRSEEPAPIRMVHAKMVAAVQAWVKEYRENGAQELVYTI